MEAAAPPVALPAQETQSNANARTGSDSVAQNKTRPLNKTQSFSDGSLLGKLEDGKGK